MSDTNGTQWIIGAALVLAIGAGLAAVFLMDTRGEKGDGLSDEFQYDISSLKNTDPALILYEEQKPSIKILIKEAFAIAIGPEDKIYIAGDKTVHCYSSEGIKEALELSLNNTPTCIGVSKNNKIYLGVIDHIEVYDINGKQLASWPNGGPKTRFTSIALHKDKVFAADFGGRRVLIYNKDGEVLNTLKDFIIPSSYFDVVVTEDGLLHVGNTGRHRIEAYSETGDMESFWGEVSNTDIKGFSGCCNPISLALLPDGQHFITAEKGLTRIKVFSRSGEFIGVVAGAEKFVTHDRVCASPDYDFMRVGLDLAVDSKGRVVVLDSATAQVRIFIRGDK